MPLARRQQKITLLDAVRVLLDQALCPIQPPAGARRFSTCEQSKAQPECGAACGEILASVDSRVIDTLLRREHLLVARAQARGPREAVEIVGAEWHRSIRRRQRLEGVIPL